MNAYADKTRKNKYALVTDNFARKRGDHEPSFQFLDKRTEIITQKLVQESMDNNPRVKQLKDFQEMANNNPKSVRQQDAETVQLEITGMSEVGKQREDKNIPEYVREIINNVLQLGSNLDSGGSIDDLLGELQLLQYNVEYWRDDSKDENWAETAPTWKKIHKSIVDLLKNCTEEKNKLNPAQNGAELASNFGPALVSLAMRITVTNASHVNSTEFAENRNINRASQRGDEELPERQGLAPNLGSDTAGSLRRKSDKLDAKGAGVCSEFAAAAASLLTGKNVRVEIMGTSVGAHNYVVVGRPAQSNATKPEAWGAGTRVVDCWWGAMKWGGYGTPYPQVIWKPTDHQKMGNVPNAVLYDSAPAQGRRRNPLVLGMANLKKIGDRGVRE
jgi:hypothetical protein